MRALTPAQRRAHRAAPPVICYPTDAMAPAPLDAYRAARASAGRTAGVTVPPRDAACIEVPAGAVLRIKSVEGPQVGDLNLFARGDLSERFWSGKTRALHGTHVDTGDRLWSNAPSMRPMATIIHDDLEWYGIDEHGGGVHDVIGTRCDPYTGNLLAGTQYHHCCHSNLTRALADHAGLPLAEAEGHVHDVLNVFMCTGFTRDRGLYFMKASPVRPGDALEMWAEIDLLAVLSACPGGDCSTTHSSDEAACHPLRMEVWTPEAPPEGWAPARPNGYDCSHGR
ncbi:MAG: urea carboxylase-associated family protein [Paracoccaceae bacterium]